MSGTDWRQVVQGLMTPEAPPRCQVCGEDRGDHDLVGCVACQTIHHLECWVYLGGCSTYACGSRRAEGPAEDEGRLAQMLAGLDLPHQHPAAPRSDSCDACRRRWRGEKGVACDACDATYHPACWVANAGCLKSKCRESPEAHHAPTLAELGDLVSGLGSGNCPVCVEPPPVGERILCSGCVRMYHPGCWRANGGCVHASCRDEAPPAELTPAPGAGAKVPPMRRPEQDVRPFTREELKLGAQLTGAFLTLAMLLTWWLGTF